MQIQFSTKNSLGQHQIHLVGMVATKKHLVGTTGTVGNPVIPSFKIPREMRILGQLLQAVLISSICQKL